MYREGGCACERRGGQVIVIRKSGHLLVKLGGRTIASNDPPTALSRRGPSRPDGVEHRGEAPHRRRVDHPHASERAEQRLTWAELLQRVFRVDGWECPHCSEQMSLRTVVIGMPACTRILTGRGVTVEVQEA